MKYFSLPPSGNSVPITQLLGHDDTPPHGLQAALATRCGLSSDRLLLAASGSAALLVLLRGLASLEPRLRGVAVPAWGCPSVPQAVLQAGLDPVLVDVDPSTLGYDTQALRDARERGLLAVVLAHYFGLSQPLPPGDWDGIAFVRDCAQDFDHRPDDGLPCFYSFGRGKALNAGHGGALCVPAGGDLLRACVHALAALPESAADPRPMALAINLLSEPHLFWVVTRIPCLGLGRTEWHPVEPARASPLFDGVGLASLEAYASCRGYYRRLVAAYRAVFDACDGDWIQSPAPAAGSRLPARFPLLVRDPSLRDRLFREVGMRFGGVTRMYPRVLPDLPGAPAGLPPGDAFPGARRVAREILTLPVTAEMRGVEAAFMACLTDFLAGAGVLRRKPILEPPFGAPSARPMAPPARPDWTATAGDDWAAGGADDAIPRPPPSALPSAP